MERLILMRPKQLSSVTAIALATALGYIAVRMPKVMAEPRVWCVLFTRASDLMAVHDPTLLFFSHTQKSRALE